MFFCVAIRWVYFDGFFQQTRIISIKKVTCKSHCTLKKGMHIFTSAYFVVGKIQLSLKGKIIFLLISSDFFMCMRHIKPLARLITVFQLLFWFSILLWTTSSILAEICLTSCLLFKPVFGIVLKV